MRKSMNLVELHGKELECFVSGSTAQPMSFSFEGNTRPMINQV